MAAQTSQRLQEAPPSEQPGLAGFQKVLTNRNFLLLWLAQLISQTILNAANFGIVVLVQDSTRSVMLVSLAIVSFLLPAVPFSALAGVIVDRLDKRQVLWISNFLRVGTMLLMFVSLVFNHSALLPLFILIFLTSLIGQFFMPAEGAAIPLLVGESELMPALSLFNITITLSQALGFLLLGRLVATIFPPFTLHIGSNAIHVASIDMLFVIVALFYAVCMVLILLIPKRCFYQDHLHALCVNSETRFDLSQMLHNLWKDMFEGWKIIRTDRLLFFGVIQLSLAGIVMQLIGTLAPTFVQSILDRPAEDMSIVLAPAAVGLVGASTLLPRFTKRIGKIRMTLSGLVVLGVGFICLPLNQWLALSLDPAHGAHSPLLFWPMIGLVFVLGIAMAVMNIPAQTLVQERAPEEGRARVLSLQIMLYSVGTIPVLLFAGAFAQLIGLDPLIFLIAITMLLVCWWGARYVRWSSRIG
jgi:MFS family permease